MDNSISTKITQLLDSYRDEGLTFEQSKEKILSEGFTSEQITLATDDYTYTVKETPDINIQAEKYFETHPKQAEEDGDKLAKAVKDEFVKDERNKAELDILAAIAAPSIDRYDIQGNVKYGKEFANDVGVSYWLLVILFSIVNVAAFIIVAWLKISGWLYVVNVVLTLGLIIVLIRRIR